MKINEVTDPNNQNPKMVPKRPQWAHFGKSPADYGAPEEPVWKPGEKSPEELAAHRAAQTAYYGHENYKKYAADLAAHNKAEMAKINALHKSRGNFDWVGDVTNPKFDPNATDDDIAMGADDDNIDNIEDFAEPEEITVGVDYDYNVIGKYRPATYHDPAEYPDEELDINRVVDLDTGEDITKLMKDDENLIELLLDKAREDYSGDDDYYDESVQLSDIKRLSGLK